MEVSTTKRKRTPLQPLEAALDGVALEPPAHSTTTSEISDDAVDSNLYRWNQVADKIQCMYPYRALLNFVGIRRLRGGFQSYSDLAPELAVSRDAA